MILSPIRNVVELIKTPVSFTDSWTRIGGRIQTVAMRSILVWLDLTINDSTELYFRAQAVAEKDDVSTYSFPTEEIHMGINKFYPKVYQVQKLEDQKVIFQVPIANLIRYIDIEIIDSSGAVATSAIVNSLKITAETD